MANRALSGAVWVIVLACLMGRLTSAPITLTYVQNIDLGTPDLAGSPAITWSGVFELSTHPSTPFTSFTLNAAAATDGVVPCAAGVFCTTLPIVGWVGDTIIVVAPDAFSTPTGLYSAETNALFSLPPQPSSGPANNLTWYALVVNNVAVASFQEKSLDSLAGAPVPEPSGFGLALAGGLTLVLLKRIQRGHACGWLMVAFRAGSKDKPEV